MKNRCPLCWQPVARMQAVCARCGHRDRLRVMNALGERMLSVVGIVAGATALYLLYRSATK